MNKVYMLLDSSGSMEKGWLNTLESINAYVAELEDKENTSVYLATFAGTVRNDLAKEWRPITPLELRTAGMTPLYDNVGKVASLAEQTKYDRTALVVITDGFENASREYSRDAIKTKLDAFTKRGWPVTFLGASFDSILSQGAELGLARGSTMSFTSTNAAHTKSAFRDLARRTSEYSAFGSLSSMAYTDSEREAFGGH